MNKFLNKKRAPEGAGVNAEAFNALSSPSLPPTSPGLKKSATSRWKKAKKPQPEPRPELNLVGALPSTDDFRTSLLMPNLSARFSMLKEQDDPNSLLGKASDDSVLQPRRRSRMVDFGFGSNGLNDIAEVNSIRSSIRPPFAYGQQEVYNSEDGYGSENESSRNGSVLARARPGEGNVLFGGRQKVYKIATTGVNSTAKLGKAVYEDDIGMSAFQRYRKEREASETWHAEDEPSFDFGLDQTDVGDQEESHATTPNDSAKDLSDTTKDLSHSPSLSFYEKKRSTASSTARSEARSSTAATSIASQPAANAPSPLVAASQEPAPVAPMPSLKRSDTKTRRLYEQSLDQHVQEQQTSALTRLNSIQRSRTLNHGLQSPPLLYGSKSATNVNELRSQQPVYALRAQSPPPMAPLTTFGSLLQTSSNNASPLASGPQSPVSPQVMEFPELSSALEPGDRGKATAMGAFNKPAQAFDENQYLQRQQQLQRSQSRGAMQRSASRGALQRSVSRGALQRKDSLQRPAMQPRAVRPELADRERSGSNSSVHQRIGRLEQVDRERSDSNASTRSRSRSAPKRHEPTQAYNVFQNAASQIPTKPGAQQYDTHRTFFGNISASDSEEEEDDLRQEYDYGQSAFGYGGHGGRWQPAGLAPVSEHPAFRGHASKPSLAEVDEDEDLQPQPLRPVPSSRSLRTDALDAADAVSFPADVVDSPTLGPSTSEPLNGMVHHLRQQSNQSSIYPIDDSAPIDEVPEMPDMSWSAADNTGRTARNTIGSESRVESTYTNSNPWDLDDIDNAYGAIDNFERSSIGPIDSMQRQSQLASRAPSRATVQLERHSEVSQDSEDANGAPWQQGLRTQHTRDASTATQAERDAFANELAARRNAIQENMKSIVERETQSRGVSPAPSAGGAFKAFGMLRSKSSRESVDVSRGPSAPTKAMRMLGISGNASSVTLNSQYERSGYSFDSNRPRKDSGSRAPPVPSMQNRGPLNDWEQQARSRGDSETSKTNGRSPPSSSQASRARSRSNSEATTGRSRSRTGPYRDDLAQAMAMGTGSSAAGLPDLSPMITRELTPRPSPEMAQSHFDGGGRSRARSTSRPPAVTSYFEGNSGSNNGNHNNNNPPVPSPPNNSNNNTGRLATPASAAAPALTLSPHAYTPGSGSGRPSPSVSPTIVVQQNPTPPLSGGNTPLATTFSPSASTNNYNNINNYINNLPTNSPHTLPLIQPRKGMLRKKTVSKFDISEPRLISSTSNVDTVDLPEGASLRNGMEEVVAAAAAASAQAGQGAGVGQAGVYQGAGGQGVKGAGVGVGVGVPPVPAINPRRMVTGRRMFGGLGRSGGSGSGGGGVSGGNGEGGGGISEDAWNYGRSKTPDPWMMMGGRGTGESDFESGGGGGGGGAGRGGGVLRARPGMPAAEFQNHSSPAIQQYGYAPAVGAGAGGGNGGAGSPERVERSPLPRHHPGMEGGMF
ncbi:hypothetical protein B0A55_06409 [Friedmanniomyces simplex]|uniref:Uncharacterized protein n=1 Tax=Friedmanniomyces simplex TaxID=329884 RepID=A0A4U0XI20_9PEZI|nr:hypothetical protein B0A55_06409 [Friedmanniomyces simplex]